MGAAEDDEVDLFWVFDVFEVLGEVGADFVEVAGFYGFGEAEGGEVGEGLAGAEVGVDEGLGARGVGGAFGGEEEKVGFARVAGEFDGGFGADEGDARVGGAEEVDGLGGGSVAGDDDEFGVFLEEEVGGGADDGFEFFGGFGAEGAVFGVTEVDEVFLGEEGLDRAEDGGAADAGVEDADGAVAEFGGFWDWRGRGGVSH